MPKLTKKAQNDAKKAFSVGLHAFVARMCDHVSAEDGEKISSFLSVRNGSSQAIAKGPGTPPTSGQSLLWKTF